MGTQEAVSGRFKCSLKYSREKLPKSPRKPTTAVRVEWEEDDEYTSICVEKGRTHRKLNTERTPLSRKKHPNISEPRPLQRRKKVNA